ncbi:Bax inhibitor-1/YccA family protein [Porphyromonas sp.]
MNNSQFPYHGEELSRTIVDDSYMALVRQSVTRAFVWMTLGLAITGLTALFVADSNLIEVIFSSASSFWILVIAEVALVWYLSSRIMKLSMPVATAAFAVYSLLNGVTLSPIFLVYTGESITSTFFITAATFGTMAVFGYTTKRDLSSWGSYLMMALIGLIIASVVNIFLGSSLLMWAVSYLGVLLFVGLTAYDTQQLKAMIAASIGDEEQTKKVALLGALNLYLDFINLFIYLLRILGKRR